MQRERIIYKFINYNGILALPWISQSRANVHARRLHAHQLRIPKKLKKKKNCTGRLRSHVRLRFLFIKYVSFSSSKLKNGKSSLAGWIGQRPLFQFRFRFPGHTASNACMMYQFRAIIDWPSRWVISILRWDLSRSSNSCATMFCFVIFFN